jgi:hypothetical protein
MKKLELLLLLLMPFGAEASLPKSMPSETHSLMNPKSNQQELIFHNQAFMTSADIASATLSNVSIKNTSGAPITVTGIYIYTLSSNPTDCTSSTLLESEGSPYGTLWAPKVTIAQNATSYIGANYLYNMMMFFLYEAKVEGQTGGNSYTPGNAEGGNNQWCLWLGVTNQAVGSGSLTSSTGGLDTSNILVQWTVADPPTSFTNITCDDSTRTCISNPPVPISAQTFPHQRS